MQLLMGLEYIHSKHIIHRLIAAQNIYLNHQGDLKIGSFGSAKLLESTLKKASTVVTAPCNMSP
jgi:NIMA (never in mitosis gene a)-related kinase 1/4/5